VADARLQELQALLREQQSAFNADCVGRTVPVLFTGHGRHPGQIVGRSPWLQPVHVIGPETLIGTETRVKLATAHTNSLSGTLAEAAHTPTQERTPA
jgi:tRNA-2-methylthio-N6-dimethylallyladenosine synthase